ncbi:uncharacterized protein MELLADRAFT_115493 [Melampsora larici-populina 98AG31]|uniref:UTP23 sensor motif region domain-containing protein n=1 Tax=Melampsora larici-populina (strain 98AG31 / pathotype 3-4-7) TaxID=747676 RepID=F4R9Y6_MELLP|nr:uncharacterized protein MELLADRAFT_115493 [Melampsora larici-populina 98AG31]EGG10615.1 hypothetical protein MELLADRAFT_115493 [Melampsora larici-populina 98AG31]
MKTKRTKANRRTMQIYNTVFSFREPYQVIVDADFMITVMTQKIDLVSRLESVLGGKVKPMITQCTISHLINLAKEGNQIAQEAVNQSRSICERRKCNHWKTKESSIKCIEGIIGFKENKLRYLIATQDFEFRTFLRKNVIGVPILYLNKSGLLLLEDEGPASELKRQEIENQKLHIPKEELELLQSSNSNPTTNLQIINTNQPNSSLTNPETTTITSKSNERLEKKLKKTKKKKEPNPLSIKKKSKKPMSSLTKKFKDSSLVKPNRFKEEKKEEIQKSKRKRNHSKTKKSNSIEN